MILKLKIILSSQDKVPEIPGKVEERERRNLKNVVLLLGS